jgi:DNA-3-methyladenine glycosylase
MGAEDLIVRIVETEAYLGKGDRASHAWRGQPTKRTEVLFQAGGIAYVYLVYGLHDMFNVVAGVEGDGSAVLVRSGEPVRGERTMVENRGLTGPVVAGDIAGGPGKLCQALAIGRDLNGVRLDRGEILLCRGRPADPASIVSGPRVGVDYAGEAAAWPLRFAESANPHVSRPRLD